MVFKEKYKHMSDQLQPSDELLNDILKSARSHGKARGTKASLLRKPAVALIVLCLCLTMAFPVLAQKVEPIYQLMYMVSPNIAQFFMPVQKSYESNGIKMEVVSAYVHENTAQIYITMQDLTDDRIDGTTDLYDSYSINRPFDSSAHCEFIGYESSTKTATFLITIDEWGNQNIMGDKITFSVREFLSHKNIYEDMEIPIDLSDASVAEHTQTISSNGGGGRDYESSGDFENNFLALIPSEPMREFPVEGIDFTGVGYIEGKLHLQTAVTERLNNDNHGFFYLKKEDGNPVNCNYNFYFSKQHQQSGPIDYCEYVFDVPQSEISKYTLYGDFVTSRMKIEGNWRVTFPLKKAE